MNLEFAEDARNIKFGLSIDSMNPFDEMRNSNHARSTTIYIQPTSLSMFEVEVYYDANAYTSPTKTSQQYQYVPKIIG